MCILPQYKIFLKEKNSYRFLKKFTYGGTVNVNKKGGELTSLKQCQKISKCICFGVEKILWDEFQSPDKLKKNKKQDVCLQRELGKARMFEWPY